MNLFKSFVIIVGVGIALSSVVAAAEKIDFKEIAKYQRADFNRTMTECDRIGAHPSDPEKVGPGFEREQMDLPAVLAACTTAVAKDPKNPRLNYQLARAYGYSGRHVEGDDYRRTAILAGYPQSLFVIGYIRITGWDGRQAEPCYGGELMRLSAQAGRIAGLLGFPHYALSGTFKECKNEPRVDKQEMMSFLEAAKKAEPSFYQRLLIEQLEQGLVKLD